MMMITMMMMMMLTKMMMTKVILLIQKIELIPPRDSLKEIENSPFSLLLSSSSSPAILFSFFTFFSNFSSSSPAILFLFPHFPQNFPHAPLLYFFSLFSFLLLHRNTFSFFVIFLLFPCYTFSSYTILFLSLQFSPSPLQYFLDTQVSLAPTHVSPSVRPLVHHTFGFPISGQ